MKQVEESLLLDFILRGDLLGILLKLTESKGRYKETLVNAEKALKIVPERIKGRERE